MRSGGPGDRASRIGSVLHPAVEDSFGLYQARVGSIVPMHAAAVGDQALAADLLGRATYGESVAALEEPRYRRASLAHLLMLQAEDQLLAPAGAPLVRAALAHRILDRLVERGDERARQYAPLASWLLGKSLLGAGHPRLAHAVFHDMRRLAGSGSEEAALRLAGRAQVYEDLRRAHPEAASVLWLLAARQFTRLDAAAPRAACQVQLGLWLLTTGDHGGATVALDLAAASLDAGFAPTLAARVHLGLAGAHACSGDRRAVDSHLASARRLYALASSPAEAISRTWSEARIAATLRSTSAEALYHEARTSLLVHGSLAEAARVTWDHAMLRLATGRAIAVDELTDALAAAFPERGASLALAMGEVARSAVARPEESYRICAEMGQHLLHRVRSEPGRPPFLVSSRLLADRLLRRRGELEDPIGAAREGL